MFELIRETPMPFHNGTGYYYKHDKTGMEVFCLKNDSEELSAAFTFATPSEDSTGLAHILEHTVLNGSGRYPVKDPFIQLVNSSPNTFLNAMTFSDKTMYPFASPLKKDFDIIFDIYADAVFNPLLRRESFEQEGVRFFDGQIDGVVFNEMRGARASEDSAVAFYCVNKLLQNTPYSYDSGGEPLIIADLQYEDYLERYKKWYSPSNCRLFLYGNLDAGEYLEKLEDRYLREENLSKWSGMRFDNSPGKYLDKIYGVNPVEQPSGASFAEDVRHSAMTGVALQPSGAFLAEDVRLSAMTGVASQPSGAPFAEDVRHSAMTGIASQPSGAPPAEQTEISKQSKNAQFASPADLTGYASLRDTKFCGAKDAYSTVLTFLTALSDDPFFALAMSTLTDLLLGDYGSPLHKAITESDLGTDLHSCSGIEADYPLVSFTVGFVGAKPDSEDEIEAFLLKTLEKIYTEGFSEDAIEGALRRQTFKLREIKGDEYPVGVGLAIRLFQYWIKGVEPEVALDQETILERLKAEVKKGRFFEGLIKKYMLDNPLRCLLTVKGDESFDDKLIAELNRKYNDYVNSLDASVYNKQKESFHTFVNTADSKEDLAKIPSIKLSDLHLNWTNCDSAPYEKNGVLFHVLKRNTHKICYLCLAFDTKLFTEEEKKLLTLFIGLLFMADSDKHSFVELGNLSKKYFGGISLAPFSTVDDKGNFVSILNVRVKFLIEDLENALDLLKEIMFDTILTDPDRIKKSLIDSITGYESILMELGSVFMKDEAGSALSPIVKETSMASGICNYLYHKELLENFDNISSDLAKKLESLRARLFTGIRLTPVFTTEEDCVDEVAGLLSRFIKQIPEVEYVKTKTFYEKYAEEHCSAVIPGNASDKKNLLDNKKLFKVSTGPSYNALSFWIGDFSSREQIIASLFADLTGGNYVLDMVRAKNGAYGASFFFDRFAKLMNYYTYRDPKIDSSYDIFEKALDYVPSLDELEKTKITWLGKSLKPFTPNSLNIIATTRLFRGYTDEQARKTREEIYSLTLQDFESIREKLKAAFKCNGIATMCSDSKASEMFKGIEEVDLGV